MCALILCAGEPVHGLTYPVKRVRSPGRHPQFPANMQLHIGSKAYIEMGEQHYR